VEQRAGDRLPARGGAGHRDAGRRHEPGPGDQVGRGLAAREDDALRAVLGARGLRDRGEAVGRAGEHVEVRRQHRVVVLGEERVGELEHLVVAELDADERGGLGQRGGRRAEVDRHRREVAGLDRLEHEAALIDAVLDGDLADRPAGDGDDVVVLEDGAHRIEVDQRGGDVQGPGARHQRPRAVGGAAAHVGAAGRREVVGGVAERVGLGVDHGGGADVVGVDGELGVVGDRARQGRLADLVVVERGERDGHVGAVGAVPHRGAIALGLDRDHLRALDVGDHGEPGGVDGDRGAVGDRDLSAADRRVGVGVDDVDVDLAVDPAVADAAAGDHARVDVVAAAAARTQEHGKEESRTHPRW
jgi:hypothetical protein